MLNKKNGWEKKGSIYIWAKKEKASKTGRVMKNQHQQFFLSVFFWELMMKLNINYSNTYTYILKQG